jgi:hypothetical protein
MEILDLLMQIALSSQRVQMHGHTLHQLMGGLATIIGGMGLWASHLLAQVGDGAGPVIGGASIGLSVAGLAAIVTSYIKTRDEGRAKLRQLELDAKRTEHEERRLQLQEAYAERYMKYVHDLNAWANVVRRTHRSVPEPPEMPAAPSFFSEPRRIKTPRPTDRRSVPPSEPIQPSDPEIP